MKTLQMILLFIGVSFISSCNSDTAAEALLEDQEMRKELMTAIAVDHAYMTEFMAVMQENEHGMQMMRGNHRMMRHMMGGEGMQMMVKDSTMMQDMMREMMNDPRMMGHMMEMMHGRGMLSDDCLDAGMEMMEGNGMGMSGNNQ